MHARDTVVKKKNRLPHFLALSMMHIELALREWFQRVKDTANGIFTTETLCFTEGRAQVKWWKQKRTLIVKVVRLKKMYRQKLLFTSACRQLLSDCSEI